MTLLEREEFVLLSEIALSEEDQDRFVDILTRRNTAIGRLVGESPEAFADEIEECLTRENMILHRLEEERGKVIERMDTLSKKRKALRSYAAAYPLPSAPRFFGSEA